MSKIELNTNISDFGWSQINTNFQEIEDEFNNKVLYRDNPVGEPNSMNVDLDMNQHRVYNLPEPLADNEAARLQDVRDAVTGITNANLISFTPSGTIAANNVQAAIQELDSETQTHFATLEASIVDVAVDNVAALRLVSKDEVKSVYMRGYYTAGDRGGGNMILRVGDNTTPGDNAIIFVANDGGRWERDLTDGIISARQCGAKGDGVTDDTSALQLWIDVSKGRKGYLPPGTTPGTGNFIHNPYIINAPLVCNSTVGGHYLYGDGNSYSNSFGLIGGSIIKNNNVVGGDAFQIFLSQNGMNVIRDFGILGNLNSGNGIYCQDLYNTHIQRMTITRVGKHGIQLVKCFNSHISSCMIGSLNFNCIYWNGLANGVSTRDCTLFGPDIVNSGWACMMVDGVGGTSLECLVDGNTFEPNTLSPNAFGMVAKGTNGLTFTGNYLEIFPAPGAVFFGDSTLSGFNVQGNYFQDGPVTFAECTNGTIDNNVFQRDTIPTALQVNPPLTGANQVKVGIGNKFIGGATNGAPAFFGNATLSGGSVTVANANANTGQPIIVSRGSLSGTAGDLRIGTVVNGASFQIVSDNAGDNSGVNWWFAGY